MSDEMEKSNRLDKKYDEETPPEDILDQAGAAKKELWLAIFLQLNRSARFTKFVEDNYDIQHAIDDEKKTVGVMVVEKPVAKGPALTGPQLAKIATTLHAAGCKSPRDTLQSLLKILAQEDNNTPSIVPATEADMKKVADLKKKLLD